MRPRAAPAILAALLAALSSAPTSGPARAGQGDAGTGAAADLVRLRLERVADAIHVHADNLLPGPVEVLLTAAQAPAASDPPLPARATVAAHGTAIVATLSDLPPGLALHALPGSPRARPRDVEYAYPLGEAPLRVHQAWQGGYSHDDPGNLHAVDFAAATGTPVLAARDGIVLMLEDRHPDHGQAPDAGNHIRILHDDGTMALYAHLQQGGIRVRPRERVRRGQVIGLSGNSGNSSAPHLHFVVQANRGMRLESIPFRMFGPGGILRFQPAQPPQPS